jgi:hypothetical protein
MSKLSPLLDLKPEFSKVIDDGDQIEIVTWTNPNYKRVADPVPLI